MTSSSPPGDARPAVLIVARLPRPLEERLGRHYECHARDGLSEAALAQLAPRIRAIVASGSSRLPRELLARFPALELIAVFGVGVDGIDTGAARERGIRVTTTPDVLTADVADLAMTLMFAVARDVVRADAFARGGAWKQGPFPLSTRVSGARLGIVGLGRIGLAIARRAEGFDMTIAYHNRSTRDGVPYRQVADVKTLAAQVDFLVLSLPGGAGTRGLVDAQVLEALGPEGFLINIARGSIVDEAALIRALQERRIAGAGLDVFEHEPDIPPALAACGNVVLTPHVASATVATRAAMADQVFDSLRDHFSSKF
ncbi:2-hydroxyacid dehydrogenase [Myxococcus fulvus]|uniref:2-hydroxyacid dehydrogenase n=1 Tax=Myxococcus fulvus TaxID=33 RepID=UPI003B9AC87D